MHTAQREPARRASDPARRGAERPNEVEAGTHPVLVHEVQPGERAGVLAGLGLPMPYDGELMLKLAGAELAEISQQCLDVTWKVARLSNGAVFGWPDVASEVTVEAWGRSIVMSAQAAGLLATLTALMGMWSMSRKSAQRTRLVEIAELLGAYIRQHPESQAIARAYA